MKSSAFTSFERPGCRALVVLIVAFATLAAFPSPGQQVSETPGIGKENHIAYVFAPYRWAFGRLFDVSRWVRRFLANEPTGQQYSYMERAEARKPGGGNPPKECTIETFRDLLMSNKDKLGVLVIISHGANKEVAIEPWGDDEKGRDGAYDNYIKSGKFTKEEITKGQNAHGFDIGVTDKFVQKYRQLGQALVDVDACAGETLLGAFVDKLDQADDRRARVALGAIDCPKIAGANEYAFRFFGDLDGQLPRKPGRSDADRLRLRAVGPAVETENEVKFNDPAFVAKFKLAGLGSTTLAPRVKEGTDFGVPCPIKAGDQIQIVLDTNADTSVVPGKDDIETQGIVAGQAKWKEGSKNILQVPVIGPAALTKTFSFKLKGDKIKSAMNVATLDGNTNPDKLEDGTGVNALGPANSKDTPDTYFVKFEDCKRVH